MKRLIDLFTNHPKEVGETYFQHLIAASTLSFVLTFSSYMQLIHAIFPFFRPPMGSDARSLILFLKKRLPENKKDINKTSNS